MERESRSRGSVRRELEAKLNEPGLVVAERDRELLATEIRLLTEYLTAVGFLPDADETD